MCIWVSGVLGVSSVGRCLLVRCLVWLVVVSSWLLRLIRLVVVCVLLSVICWKFVKVLGLSRVISMVMWLLGRCSVCSSGMKFMFVGMMVGVVLWCRLVRLCVVMKLLMVLCFRVG